MDRAAEFYSALGFHLVRHSHPPCGEHYSTVGGECIFEICRRSKDQGSVTPIFFGLNVPNAEQAVEVALKNGGSVIRDVEESDWGKSGIIRDLDGHKVMLIERG